MLHCCLQNGVSSLTSRPWLSDPNFPLLASWPIYPYTAVFYSSIFPCHLTYSLLCSHFLILCYLYSQTLGQVVNSLMADDWCDSRGHFLPPWMSSFSLWMDYIYWCQISVLLNYDDTGLLGNNHGIIWKDRLCHVIKRIVQRTQRNSVHGCGYCTCYGSWGIWKGWENIFPIERKYHIFKFHLLN